MITGNFVANQGVRPLPANSTCNSSAWLRNISLQHLTQPRDVTRPEGTRASTRFCATNEAAVQEVTAEVDGEGAMELREASFHTIRLDGCEFLVATTPDEKLDLRDVYVRDSETEIFSQPASIGDLPELPTRFLEMEWAEEYSGDTLMQKEGWRKVHKVYLVEIVEQDPYRLNLENVYSIDNKERVLQKEKVQRATEETDPTLITLRIRPEGLLIEENSEMIDDWDLVEEYLVQQEIERMERAEAAQATTEVQVPWEDSGTPRDPIDALNDDEREYDESFEDTPEVDQGY